MTQTQIRPIIDTDTAKTIQLYLDRWYNHTVEANRLASLEANTTDNIGAVKNLTGWREVMAKSYRIGDLLDQWWDNNCPYLPSATLTKLQWKSTTLAEVFIIY
jgi:hypothetical protein